MWESWKNDAFNSNPFPKYTRAYAVCTTGLCRKTHYNFIKVFGKRRCSVSFNVLSNPRYFYMDLTNSQGFGGLTNPHAEAVKQII